MAASPVFLFSPLVVQKLNMNALTYCSKVKCWKRAVRHISVSCNTSWSVLPLHVFSRHVICHEVSSPFMFVCFWRYGDHFAIKGRQKATLWKSELGALIQELGGLGERRTRSQGWRGTKTPQPSKHQFPNPTQQTKQKRYIPHLAPYCVCPTWH